MNSCGAGLYSFASTSCWLREKGVASPPSLVVLGLMLPDSRMLSGIASIGLTLINIAIILPHLRQPILDSMYTASKSALAGDQSLQEQAGLLSPERFDAMQSIGLNVESLVLVSVSRDDVECQSSPIKSICSIATRPLESLDAVTDAGPQITLIPTTNNDGLAPHSLDTGFSPRHSSSSHLLAREGRDALYIPLPVPDDLEIAFFDTTDALLPDDGLGEMRPVVNREKDGPHAEHPTIEDHDLSFEKSVEQINQHDAVHRLGQTGRAEIDKDLRDMATSGTTNNIVPNETTVSALKRCEPATEGTSRRRRNNTVASEVGHSGVREKEPQRPESLQFIPQSVVSRYPSAPTVSANNCFGHRAIISGHDHQSTPITPDILVGNPGMLLGGTIPQANYTTLEGQWRASFLPGSQRRTLVIQAIPAQDNPMRGLTPPSERRTGHEATPPGGHLKHSRRLGVLARAAPRNRRATARQGRNTFDGSSISDSDSDSDTDSQDSSGSSTDESMLPHILGTDLIAALDSNSESGLNIAGSRKALTQHIPFDVYRDFLVSDDSTTDVSMMMHVSSIDGAPDGEMRIPATFRLRTYEEIQQWASGVVQKCVRQVCRSRTHVDPMSPSQASDVCAERPSGSAISKCPLSGLHCKLGHTASTKVPMPRTNELPAPLAPASPPDRKPLSVRNLNVRDIPEFVPRQRQVSVVPGRVEGPRRSGTRSTIDATRDAATEVIARMESQAGFSTRQWVVGMDERRIMSTVGGFQRTLRCA